MTCIKPSSPLLKINRFLILKFFLHLNNILKIFPLALFPKFKKLRKLERPLAYILPPLSAQQWPTEILWVHFWKINRFLILKFFLHQNNFLQIFPPCIFSKILENKKVRAPIGLYLASPLSPAMTYIKPPSPLFEKSTNFWFEVFLHQKKFFKNISPLHSFQNLRY
jgi:hypothetical protein